MKVILPNGVIAECGNPVVTEQWKKAGYREVAPAQPETKKPVPKRKARQK